MKITKISYGKTINLGNYQSARLDLEAEIEPTDDPYKALQELKVHVKVMADQIIQENKQ